eukprot:3031537-Rhodomonas_salina.3
MEAKLGVEEAKKHAILDKLLTAEGYWSAPPSSHEGSNSNSGDEKGDAEPATQAPTAGYHPAYLAMHRDKMSGADVGFAAASKRKAPEHPALLLGKVKQWPHPIPTRPKFPP